MNLRAAVSGPPAIRRAERRGMSKYANWLEPEDVLCGVEARDCRGALEIASAAIAERHALDPALIQRALWRREQVGSTALGHGIAIPHARIEGIDRPLTLFMRTRDAIEFGAPDGHPVNNILAMLVPADGNTDDHLQFLALVSQMFSDADFRARLGAAPTAVAMRRVFADHAHRVA
jgi:nitrogen PTS system EIIA component